MARRNPFRHKNRRRKSRPATVVEVHPALQQAFDDLLVRMAKAFEGRDGKLEYGFFYTFDRNALGDLGPRAITDQFLSLLRTYQEQHPEGQFGVNVPPIWDNETVTFEGKYANYTPSGLFIPNDY